MDLTTIGLVTVFAAGIISFLSPCVLPLVPGYISYVAGQSLQEINNDTTTQKRIAALVLSCLFVLGFSTVFVTLGASVTALGQVLLRYKYEANLVGGGIVIVFGLFMTGLFKPLWLQRDVRFHGAVQGSRPLMAYVLGLSFAFGWTPCIGPVLGAILTLSATSLTANQGILMLSVYSLGLGLPFIVTALFTGRIVGRMRRLRAVGARLQIIAGITMVIMGVAMMTGQLTVFAYWLLRMFPALSTIG